MMYDKAVEGRPRVHDAMFGIGVFSMKVFHQEWLRQWGCDMEMGIRGSGVEGQV